MNKINTDKQGFAILEFLVVFVMVALVGAAGFFVWQKASDGSKLSEAESASGDQGDWTILPARNFIDSKNKITFSAPNSAAASGVLVNDSTVQGGRALRLTGQEGQGRQLNIKFDKTTNPSFDFENGALYELCVNLNTKNSNNTRLEVDISGYGTTASNVTFNKATNGYELRCAEQLTGKNMVAQQYFAKQDKYAFGGSYTHFYISVGGITRGLGKGHDVDIADIRIRKVPNAQKIEDKIMAENTLSATATINQNNFKDSILLNDQQKVAYAPTSHFQLTSDPLEQLSGGNFAINHGAKTSRMCVVGKVSSEGKNGAEASKIKIVGFNGTRKTVVFNYSNGENQVQCTDAGQGTDNSARTAKAELVSGSPFTVERFIVKAVK